jgi:SAM-dependent methyltransferase
MNFHKMSVIGHTRLRFAHPIGEAKIERLLGLLPPLRTVLDVGAGKGELLKRLRASGVALELHEDVAPKPRGRLQVVIGDAKRYEPGRTFDAGFCIAATHALGGYLPTLKKLSRWVKPGGFIAVGEGYWLKRPARGYLKVLEATSRDYGTHEQNIARAEALGLTAWWSATASADEWDEYEWSYSGSIERFAVEHPRDPDVAAMVRRIRAWRRARLKWGRDTLGFGLYLFRNGRSR